MTVIDVSLISDIDDCSPNQCQNSGTCVDGVDSFSCTCAVGYEGDLCETSEWKAIILVIYSGHIKFHVQQDSIHVLEMYFFCKWSLYHGAMILLYVFVDIDDCSPNQ